MTPITSFPALSRVHIESATTLCHSLLGDFSWPHRNDWHQKRCRMNQPYITTSSVITFVWLADRGSLPWVVHAINCCLAFVFTYFSLPLYSSFSFSPFFNLFIIYYRHFVYSCFYHEVFSTVWNTFYGCFLHCFMQSGTSMLYHICFFEIFDRLISNLFTLIIRIYN